MIKGPIHQEDIIIISIYAPTLTDPKYMKQTLTELKGETDSNKITVRDFNTLLSILDKTFRQNISKETEDFNNTEAKGT